MAMLTAAMQQVAIDRDDAYESQNLAEQDHMPGGFDQEPDRQVGHADPNKGHRML